MKIIYRGGYNKNDRNSVLSSMFYEYCQATKEFVYKNKKVVFVTFAKPDHYYDQILKACYENLPNIIDNSINKTVDWGLFDLIYLPGGDIDILKDSLLKYDFSLDKLKKDVIIIGDSAGSSVMSKYYLDYKETKNGSKDYFIAEGLNSNSHLLTITHIDNSAHVTPGKIKEARKVAENINVKLLLLKENEAKIVENNGEIKDFSINKVLI